LVPTEYGSPEPSGIAGQCRPAGALDFCATARGKKPSRTKKNTQLGERYCKRPAELSGGLEIIAKEMTTRSKKIGRREKKLNWSSGEEV